MRDRYVDELLNNYEAFHLMIRSTSMLATRNSKNFDRDAATLIDFIGASYGWRQELIDAAADLILGDMMRVALISDVRALASADMLDDFEKDNLILYEVKGAALEEVARSETFNCGQPIDKAVQGLKSGAGFLAFHHVYEPVVRYAQLSLRADCGEPLSTLQIALMRILGIGCDRSIAHAQQALERALLWGSKEACKVLRYLWEQEGNHSMVSFLESVYTYLGRSCELQDPLAEGAEDTKAAEYCILIAGVRSIVHRCGEIDVAFADLLNRDDIPFPRKLAWIAKYKESAWLRGYQPGREPLKIGFLA